LYTAGVPIRPGAALTPPIVACFAVTALAHAAVYLLNALLPLHAAALGATSTEVGLLFTVATTSSMVLRPLVGGWNDRCGFRRVALPGAAVLLASTAALAAAGRPAVIIALMAGVGVGNALVTTSAGIHVARASAPAHRGEALSLYYVATSVGCAVGPPLGFLLHARAGMAAGFAAALVALAGTAAGAAAVRAGARAGAVAGPPGRRVLSRRAAPLSAVLVLVTLGHPALFAFLPLHAIAAGQGAAVGWFFALYSSWVIGCRVVFRRAGDRLGRSRVVALAIGATAGGYAVLAAPPGPATLVLGALCLGGGAALLYPTLVALLVDRTPEAERGLALGTLSASWDVGVAAGALLLGLTAERASYGGAFALASATTALGLAAFVALERRRRGPRRLPGPAAGVSF
jgi:MFS family permease